MTIHVHALRGCAPTPLAHYLKALGLLRIIAEQRDAGARGAWRNDTWVLATSLDREELEDFLLHHYAPTPLVAPWNKGSGFFQADPGLAALAGSKAPRFENWRAGITAAVALCTELNRADAAVRAIKQESKDLKDARARKRLRDSADYRRRLADAERGFKDLKATLIPECRLTWRGPHQQWLDAALTLDGEGKAWFPALLGTGGNDGRLDFTNNAMQRLATLFDLQDPAGAARPEAAAWLRAALYGERASGLISAAVGQYLPGAAGGANSTTAAEGSPLLNPWDFVLMLEGAVLFAAQATRRFTHRAPIQASAPFAVRGHAAGYASASSEEESARGEQWMPLWERPLVSGEVRGLLAEGRAQVRSRQAERPLDLARAVARLGTARGLSAFERYAYLERNGQSNLAVPLGRINVRARPRAHLIDDLDHWLNRLHRLARANTAPARLQNAERRLADAVFAALTHDDDYGRWQSVLLAAAAVEAVQATGAGVAAGPIPPLRPDWVLAVDDRSPEFRLGLALALAGSPDARGRTDSLRHHWLPLEPGGMRFATREGRLVKDLRVVATGRNAVADCLAVLERRLVEGLQSGGRHLPIRAGRRAAARAADLADLVAGRVDLERTVVLARALMALRRAEWDSAEVRPESRRSPVQPEDAWIALRLAMLPWPLESGRDIGTDPAILRRLGAGDAGGAVGLALRRLSAVGLQPTVQAGTAEPRHARIWAAALAFPINPSTARRLAGQLDPAYAKEMSHAS